MTGSFKETPSPLPAGPGLLVASGVCLTLGERRTLLQEDDLVHMRTYLDLDSMTPYWPWITMCTMKLANIATWQWQGIVQAASCKLMKTHVLL